MFRAAIFAVLAVALSSSPVLARQVANADADTTWVIDAAALDSIRKAIAATEVIPTEGPSLSQPVGTLAPVSLNAAAAVTAESNEVPRRPSPWWATTLAVAGPLADGLSTVYAIRQSGPNAHIAEGNGFYQKLFGADVKPGEIMAFKVGQAALFGAIVHYAGLTERKGAIGVALLTAGVNFFVASQNMRAAAAAKRLNTGAR